MCVSCLQLVKNWKKIMVTWRLPKKEKRTMKDRLYIKQLLFAPFFRSPFLKQHLPWYGMTHRRRSALSCLLKQDAKRSRRPMEGLIHALSVNHAVKPSINTHTLLSESPRSCGALHAHHHVPRDFQKNRYNQS